MQVRYQLLLLGNENPLILKILYDFFARIDELGIDRDLFLVMYEKDFHQLYKSNFPIVCVYFGKLNGDFKNLDILEKLLEDASLIIPTVNDITTFKKEIPEVLHVINGFELSSDKKVDALVSLMLEGFNLLRVSRRLFISYKRTESTSIAIQLFERLEQAGFDVFLDTHSIRQGEVFQDELWHRLVDTDVVVLLNTPGFLKSEWTVEELAKASAMSIGILQLIWPKSKPENESHLSIHRKLTDDDFNIDKLKDNILEDIIMQVERLRARTLAARQDNLITEFIKFASQIGINAVQQKERFITIDVDEEKEIVIIPTIGIPQAFTYNKSEEFVKMVRSMKKNNVFLLYDHINIREKWLNHLSWLDLYLPVKTIKITDAIGWLKKIKQ